MASLAIGAGASILSGALGGKGASKAAKTQAAAYQKGIDETARQFNVTQQNLQPYLQAGNSGLTALQGLLGLSGDATQQSAISALQASPLYTSQYGTGVDTILQNSAATGGLRGGNTQNSLANFGSSLLSSVIQNQLSNYGGLASLGSGTATTLGSLGAQNSSQISSLLGQQGSANATAAAAPYAAATSTINGLAGLFGGSTGGAKW